MINTNSSYDNMFNSVAREFVGRVELLEGSTLVKIFEHDGALISFTVDKAGDNTKFFGYGICQKATVKLRDKERAINIKRGQGLQIAHGIKNDYLYSYPLFYVDEIKRDEKTNELTITAYDAIYKAKNIKHKELILPNPYTLKEFAVACAGMLGMSVNFKNIPWNLLYVEYDREQANFNGEETLHECLDDIAEMFGAIYYLNNNWELTFQRLDIDGEPVQVIDKSKYFDLVTKTEHTLHKLVSVTELGDNVATVSDEEGETQYLRENAFLVLRDDIGILLENIMDAVRGLTICQYDCKHRGDFRIELGDKVALTTKDNHEINSYVLDDSITYKGGLSGSTRWEHSITDDNVDSNPSTLGDILKQTFAKVDKVNGQITLLTIRTEEVDQSVAQLQINADNITQSVSDLSIRTNELGEEVAEMERTASLMITPEDVSILVQGQLGELNGITTATGFTFNDAGLNVNKSGAATSTIINENGMKVIDSSQNVLLEASGHGVAAKDLKATTYLTIGYSRFEDYRVDGSVRTGCFWLGGIY